MAEPVLDQPRIMAGIGQGIAAGVAQHVGMDPEGQLRALANGLHEAVELPFDPARAVSRGHLRLGVATSGVGPLF